jgi:glycosidase
VELGRVDRSRLHQSGHREQGGKRPQFPIDPAKAEPILDDYKARGVSAIEIFAPYYGGRSYGGLDAIDRINLNPKVGTMDDFRALVRLIHSKGMAVISFDNLGYCSSESPDFLKAADDVRAGRDTPEARRFLWADSADAPPPGPDNDKFFMVRPRHLPNNYNPDKSEFWAYNARREILLDQVAGPGSFRQGGAAAPIQLAQR